MVSFLGFLKKGKDKNQNRISNNTPVNSTDSLSLSFSDAYLKINTKELENIKSISEKLTPYLNTYSNILKNLQSILNQLENDHIEVEDSRFQSVVEKSKKTVVDSLKKELVFQNYELNTINDIVSFKNKLNIMIKKFEDLSKSHKKIFNFFIQKYTSKLQSEIDNISAIYKAFDSTLNEFEVKRSSLTDVKQLLDSINAIQISKEDAEKEMKKMDISIKTTEDRIREVESQIQIIKNSNEYAKFIVLNENIESLNKEIGKFHQQLLNNFGHINRALAKYSYGLNQKDLDMINKMLNTPWEIFSDKDFSLYLNHLIKLQKELQTKRISVKDSDKTEIYLDEIIDSIYDNKKIEENLNSKYKSLLNEKLLLNIDKMESLEIEKEEQLSVLENNKNILSEMAEKINTSNENIDRLKVDFERRFKSLFGQKYSLV